MTNKFSLRKYLLVLVAVAALVAVVAVAASASGYVHGIVITVDGEDYYLAGAPDGPGGAIDVPGHEWMQTGPNRLEGLHYNTGPQVLGAPWEYWSYAVDPDVLLFTVEGVIDTWSPGKAGKYATEGFVHYHELVRVSDGERHPRKVVWLRHTPAYTDAAGQPADFLFDGGPHTELAHLVDLDNPLIVYNGYHYQFIPNYFMPYSP